MKKAEDLFTVFSFDTMFKTRSHHLDIKVSNTSALSSDVRDNKITITTPQSN